MDLVDSSFTDALSKLIISPEIGSLGFFAFDLTGETISGQCDGSDSEIKTNDFTIRCIDESILILPRPEHLLGIVFSDDEMLRAVFFLDVESLNSPYPAELSSQFISTRELTVNSSSVVSAQLESSTCDVDDPETECGYSVETVYASTVQELIEDEMHHSLEDQSAGFVINASATTQPEVVGLFWSDVAGAHTCTGEMLTSRYILTAAHCLDSTYPNTSGTSVVTIPSLLVRRGDTITPSQIYNGVVTAYRNAAYTEDTRAHLKKITRWIDSGLRV